MCGIFGIGIVQGTTVKNRSKILKLITLLGKKTEPYGRVSSGIAVANPLSINFVKHNLSLTELLKTSKVESMLKTNIFVNSIAIDTDTYAIMGHGRFPTQGSEKNNVNNHPLKVGNIVGIHAGHISNNGELFLNRIKTIQRIGLVDSEIIFQLINKERSFNGGTSISMEEAIKTTTSQLHGGFACAVVSSLDKNKLYLFRRSTPLDVHYYNKLGLVMFATSHANIVREAMQKVFTKDELDNEKIGLDTNEALAIDFKEDSFYKFSIEPLKKIETDAAKNK